MFLFTTERFDRDQAALAVSFGLNGLRVSEACRTTVKDLGFERGHRVLRRQQACDYHARAACGTHHRLGCW